MTGQAADGNYTTDVEQVLTEELEWIKARRRASGTDSDTGTVGLAFSGGGIRSATFNLGVLQALEKSGLIKHIDYLSSVSGGGYIASCFSWLRSQLSEPNNSVFAEPVAQRPNMTVLDWLRSHGKYLISEKGFSSWTLVASVLAAVLLNLLVLLPPLLVLVGLGAKKWLPLDWPVWLRWPHASPMEDHSGFALMLLAGLACLVGYLATAIAFALVSGIRSIRSASRILFVRRLMGRLMWFGVALIALGLIPVLVTLDELLIRSLENEMATWFAGHLMYLVPQVVGLLTLWRAGSGKSSSRTSGRWASVGLAIFLYGILLFAYHLTAHTNILQSTTFYWLLALSFLLALVCDINWISMHSYYRARLADAYQPSLARRAAADQQSGLDFKLTEIQPNSGTPFPIINTTMNTTSSQLETLRSRGGDNFVMTPLFCGALSTGYRRTKNYIKGKLTLSTAFTISGAAVDPNTYATRSRSISALMALLNFRLGYWGTNPKVVRNRHLPLPWWYVFIGREMLGVGLSEKTRHVHLSDGGHFENLGVYELLRRRCRYIITSDAGADPELTLSELGKVVERARTDFGVEVDIKPKQLKTSGEIQSDGSPFLVGSARYADGSIGEILYIKPMMQPDLTVDIYSYWRDNPSFPNTPTSNQFFGERQFSAYRELGLQIVDQLIQQRPDLNIDIDIEMLFAQARDAN